MKFNPADYLNSSLDSLESSKLLLENNFTKGSINRSYYSIFYCVQLLVLSEGIFAKTHSGLKAKFNELFAKTGKVELEKAKVYDRIFQERLAADYDIDAEISTEEAKEALDFASDFFEFTTKYFENYESI